MHKLIYIILLISLFGCDFEEKVKKRLAIKEEKKAELKKKKKKKNGLSITKYKNGKKKTSINYKDGVKHGTAKNFYSNGKLKLICNYIDGQRDGVLKYFYENGNIFRETPYNRDRINGIKKRYRENGKIMSEASYLDDAPGLNLKEYLTNGKLKTKYPKIIVKPEDKMLLNDKYYLHISLSEKLKNPEFYRGKLKEGKWFELGPEIGRLQTINKKTTIIYPIPKGYSVMEKVHIIATYKTRMGNTKILQKVYNLAIDNVN